MERLTEEQVWNKVMLARHPKRPTAKTLIDLLIKNFIELHGDRLYRDDSSIIGGIGYLGKMPVTIIAQEKGVTTNEKIEHNFGMPHPEGYRKALRLMKQAEKFNRPIIFIIDTPGAYPGIGAEERGQASAIANNLMDMIDLKVPLISLVLSEGGSGGALAIGVSDEVWMFENAIYSVLSPEGFASILYKDASLAKKAALKMKLTSEDLYHYQIIDNIIPEVNEGLHENVKYSVEILRKQLISKIKDLQSIDREQLLASRYQKYRQMSVYEEK
ncbi:acetyl-CoA carboxylase carboxyltransferase subunit alpha [Mycoplasmatota bacterium]|nr:acetyl-CoA carboxylase carboxyltransferase subunit alpha [Mycoplasmatota bacterium]